MTVHLHKISTVRIKIADRMIGFYLWILAYFLYRNILTIRNIEGRSLFDINIGSYQNVVKRVKQSAILSISNKLHQL